MSDTPTAQEVVDRMLLIREQRAQLKKDYEEQDRVLRKQWERGENWLLAHMQETGHKKFTVAQGNATVFTSSQQRASIPDWTAFCDYLRETGEVDLLQKRISTTNLKQLVDSGRGVPPGVNVEEVITVNIRRT